MREFCNKTAELTLVSGMLEIARGDFCDAFVQDADRLFSARECWYCKYGDFGIFTEYPTQNGLCRLENRRSRKSGSDLYQKKEDKRT